MASAQKAAASCSWSAGTTSLTNPTAWARWALSRSWLPISETRMISPNGIFWSMWMGSNAAVIP